MSSDDSEFFKSFFWGIGIAALIVFSLAQPLIKFASPVALFSAGKFVGITVAGAYLYHIFSETIDEVRLLKVGANVLLALVTVLAVVQLQLVISDAEALADAADRRCLVIELEMLRGNPRRSDLPDLYQAFACRQQTSKIPKRPN